MKKPDLAVVFEEGFPDEPFVEFKDAVSASGLDVVLESRPAAGPYGGVEWFIPTAIVFFVAKSYFDGFLKEAGKDHYQVLRSKLSKTAAKTMQLPRIEPVLVGTEGKVRKDSPYSPRFPFMQKPMMGIRLSCYCQSLAISPTTRRSFARFSIS